MCRWYITDKNEMKKMIIIAVACMTALTMQAQQFVDLGLPSGTLWKNADQFGLSNHYDAVNNYDGTNGCNLPTLSQWEELISVCQWESINGGIKVTGPNGKSIILSSKGIYDCNDHAHMINCGFYWSSSVAYDNNGEEVFYHLYFCEDELSSDMVEKPCARMSVRLVKNK